MPDVLDLSTEFAPEEAQTRAATRKYLQAEVAPHVRNWFESETLPEDLGRAFGSLGLFGVTLPAGYGGSGLSNAAYGLVMYELERVDSGLRSFVSVQAGLSMFAIERFGSEEQKRDYLPSLASGERLACFALTEADGGSDPGAMRTHVRRDGSDYLLYGSKMWITNGTRADVAVVWAKNEEGAVRGFLVPTDRPGLRASDIKHKLSLRASVSSELAFDGVRLSSEHLLPGAEGLKAPLSCLTNARFGIVWGAMGALDAVYEEALEYAQTRTTFGKPIAARQLVQAKLVEMATGHSLGTLLALRLARLKDAGELRHPQVSLAKRHNVRAALRGARSAREILGGNGITLEYDVMRHMVNLETVDTYEGTYDIHTLIVGRELTGHNALV
jgi:glutaryl-CoA dehydrogenase